LQLLWVETSSPFLSEKVKKISSNVDKDSLLRSGHAVGQVKNIFAVWLLKEMYHEIFTSGFVTKDLT
jgi:hypothetical protein